MQMSFAQTTPALIVLLPADADVAHKTGTIGGVVNDSGIIYLPDGAGRDAIAVLSKRARAATETDDRPSAERQRVNV